MNKEALIQLAQTWLRMINKYDGNIDGQIGPKTVKAMNDYLPDRYEYPDLMRRCVAVIQCAAMDCGQDVGAVDGYYGPRTEWGIEVMIAAMEGKEPSMFREAEKTITRKDVKHLPTYNELDKVYGVAGSNIVQVEFPYKLRIAWDPSMRVQSTQCNAAVKDDIRGIFEAVGKEYDANTRAELGIDLWGGCFNYRKMRGGSKLSTHSWGIAFDIDPARNGLKTKWKDAALSAPECQKFIDIITVQFGWMSLGKERDYDAMHFQKSR